MTANFPYRTVTVAFGPGRDATFDEATDHFDDTPKRGMWRIDATGLDESDVLTEILNFVRTGGIDQIAVDNPGPQVLARLAELAETGSAVVVSMDVASLDEARSAMSEAIGHPIQANVVALGVTVH